MANFTTENNTYYFRIGPAFLDTWNLEADEPLNNDNDNNNNHH